MSGRHSPAIPTGFTRWPPVAIDGHIRTPGDSDYFVFTTRRGEKLVLQVQARRFDSPLDSILTLYNAKSQQLAENDDWNDPMEAPVTHQADSRLLYTFPAAGDYILRLRDVEGKGGEEYGYRLVMAADVPPGKAIEVKQDSDTPIAIRILRQPNAKAGVSFGPIRIANGTITSKSAFVAADKDEATITLTVAKGAKAGLRQDVIFSGVMRAGNQTIKRFARAIPIQVVAGE